MDMYLFLEPTVPGFTSQKQRLPLCWFLDRKQDERSNFTLDQSEIDTAL